MELTILTKSQIKDVYRNHLRHNFPDDEQKPLAMILRAIDQGRYCCFGWMEKHTLICYAFFVKTGTHYLLDYLATVSEHRNQGFGSAFFSELVPYLIDAESVLVEVEAPSYSASPEEAKLRDRRLQFYLRNGFCRSEVIFGNL